MRDADEDGGQETREEDDSPPDRIQGPRGPHSDEGPQIDPPSLRLDSGSPTASGPSVLGYADSNATDAGVYRTPDFWIQILKGEEQWDALDPDRQKRLLEWWERTYADDPERFNRWLSQNGLDTVTVRVAVSTATLFVYSGSTYPIQDRLRAAQPAGTPQVPMMPAQFERDVQGVLQPVVDDDKAVGTGVLLDEPEPTRGTARGWLVGTLLFTFLAGGTLGYLAQGTEPTVAAAPPVAVTDQSAPPTGAGVATSPTDSAAVPVTDSAPSTGNVTTHASKTASLRDITGASCSEDAKRGIPTGGTFDFTLTRSGDEWTMQTQSGSIGTATSPTPTEVTIVFPLKNSEPVAGLEVRSQSTEVMTFTGTSLSGTNHTHYEFVGSMNGVDLDGQICDATFDFTGTTDQSLDFVA